MLQAIRRGDDPTAEREAKKALPLWEDLVAAFRAKHLPKKKPSTVKRYEGVIGRVLTPALKKKRVVDITTAMISAAYARKSGVQAEANNALRVLSKMMTFAIGEGMRTTQPGEGHRAVCQPDTGSLARRARTAEIFGCVCQRDRRLR